jgi:hypothetical protein
MKILNKNLFYAISIIMMGLFACKKDKGTSGSTVKDVVTSQDYVFNLATRNLTPTNSVSVNIKSEVGVRFVYNYLVRTGLSDSLVNITYATADNQKDLTINIPNTAFSVTNMQAASGIRSVIKRIDNSSDESIVKLTSFQPPLPILSNFPVSKLPDANGRILIVGKATSETGLARIELLDDSTGPFTLITTISNLNGVKSYDLSYDYTYRANTANFRIIAFDTFGIRTEYTIRIPALPYTLYQNVNMGSQGNATETVLNNHFFISNGTTAGTCQLPLNELNLDFLYYGTGSGGNFYAPTNIGNVATNYRCNGASAFWTPNAANLKATRFRVLVPGDGGVIDALYANFNANTIPDLDDTGFFNGIPIPSGNTARFLPTGTLSTSLFNTTTGYLIWVKVPTIAGPVTPTTVFKNCIIRVRDAVNTATTSLATVRFDIYVQK